MKIPFECCFDITNLVSPSGMSASSKSTTNGTGLLKSVMSVYRHNRIRRRILSFIRQVPDCPDVAALYAISIHRAGILPSAFFRFRLATDTLAVRLMVPSIRVHRGLAPPSLQSTTTVDRLALARHAPYQAHTGHELTGFTGRIHWLKTLAI